MSKKTFHLIEGQVAKERHHPILTRNAERSKHDIFREEQGFHVDEDLVNNTLVPPSFSVEQENPGPALRACCD